MNPDRTVLTEILTQKNTYTMVLLTGAIQCNQTHSQRQKVDWWFHRLCGGRMGSYYLRGSDFGLMESSRNRYVGFLHNIMNTRNATELPLTPSEIWL